MDYEYWIDILSKTATIITAGTLVFAFISYRYQRKRDRLKDAANQLTFFREKILEKNKELFNYIRTKTDSNYKVVRIKFDIPDLKVLKIKEPLKSLAQIKLSTDQKILDIQNDLFNLLEELSVKIRAYETLNRGASLNVLEAIKPSFVEIIEQNATFALFNKDIISGKHSYSESLDLYAKWKDDVDRKTPEERLEEFNKR